MIWDRGSYTGFCMSPGPCQADAKAFCKDVEAGESRLSASLTEKIRAQNKGNVAGVYLLASLC